MQDHIRASLLALAVETETRPEIEGFLDLFDIDWSNYGVPGACLPGHYYTRLLLLSTVDKCLKRMPQTDKEF